ncbi:MAG: hypothetical protein GC136_02460 [Alphaproteobacteria bacterium]|nr:hypothetical protein [Alphaproteobacteria bacterium]
MSLKPAFLVVLKESGGEITDAHHSKLSRIFTNLNIELVENGKRALGVVSHGATTIEALQEEIGDTFGVHPYEGAEINI